MGTNLTREDIKRMMRMDPSMRGIVSTKEEIKEKGYPIMNYKIFKITYRIPIKIRDKLELPSIYAICDYIAEHKSDSRECILETTNDVTAKKQWDILKNLSLFIPAPYPYVLVETYELDKTDLSKHVSFLTEKGVEKISNIVFLTGEEVDNLAHLMKLDQTTREKVEKQKMEEINNAKRRR